MRIDISVHVSDARRWLDLLKATLEADGHHVAFRIWGKDRGRDASLTAMKLIEAAFFGLGRRLWRFGQAENFQPVSTGHADLVIELSADAPGSADFTLFLDGEPGVERAFSALLARFVPYVEIRDIRGEAIAGGLPAVEEPEVILRALDAYFARLVTILRQAVQRHGAAARGPAPPGRLAPQPEEPAIFALRSVSGRILRRLTGRRPSGDHWRIGIRPRSDGAIYGRDTLIDGFVWLEDDGQRFYADPILFERAGRHFLFLEEYPYATRRGVIAYTEIGEDGRALHPPVSVLESSSHFSYPFLFEHEGAVYMLPENAGSGRLALYRAENFPDRWVLDRVLLDKVRLHDPTLVEREGRWWLMAMSEEGGSSWDCLSLFHAPSPLGPFAPVAGNPVLIDARFARPAGPVIEIDGRMIRPVQSCLGGYGRFIRFLALDGLSDAGIEQRELGRLLAPLGGDVPGVHSYCADSRFEAIDALRPGSR